MNSNGDCLQWRRLILIKVLTVLMAPEAFAFPMAGEKMAKHSQPGFPRHANNSRSYNDADSLSSTPRQRRRQIRRKSVDRQPRFYWTDPENLRLEIFLFWRNCGVVVEPTTVPEASSSHHDNHTSATQLPPPTIPNEIFLMHYERHDLRGAIVKNGGRECVSKLLGGAPIMPGRWSSATTPSSLSLCPELKELLRLDPSLSIERPPRVRTSSAVAPKEEGTGRRWLHQNDRNRMGYWSLQTVIQELYEYVDTRKEQLQRPSVWMPRPSEMATNGRDDLRQAMNRFGGFRGICRTAGMVPYQEWFFFEGQLDLLVELKRYLDEFSGCDYRVFPKVLDIERNGFVQLHSLIQYYGGRKFLAARLSMLEPLCTKSHSDHGIRNGGPVSSHSIMKFGLFDLDFAVRLLKFVREDHLKRSPPLKHPVLSMPSRSKLLSNALEGEWLCAKIDEFGGDENVARRLGLELFATESIVTEKQRMGSFSERYSQQ